jgi:hypothetical protein
MTIQKIQYKELNETHFSKQFFMMTMHKIQARQKGKSLAKIKTESLNKMHSHLIQAYIFQGLLSHQS